MTSPQANAASQKQKHHPVNEPSEGIDTASLNPSAFQRCIRAIRQWPLMTWTAVVVSMIGCQSLVASGLSQPRISVMLPFGSGDERLRQQFLRGFAVGEESVKACDIQPPRAAWLGLPPDASPDAALSKSVDWQLVVAPPGADLRAFSELAERRQLSVLLPYQRGASLLALRSLGGRERLWPMVPSRKDDLKAIVDAAVQRGWTRVMVVQDLNSLESTEAQTFVELFEAAGGRVQSYTPELIQTVSAENAEAFNLLSQDMLWSRVPAMVIAAAPGGALAQKISEHQSRGDFGIGVSAMPNWIWLSDPDELAGLKSQDWKQMGLGHAAHGEGWSTFAEAYEARWGEQPDLLEASGYDTARILALAGTAPPPTSQEGTIDAMGWVDPDAEPVEICQGLEQRRRREKVRLKSAGSDFRLQPGRAPSGQAAVALFP